MRTDQLFDASRRLVESRSQLRDFVMPFDHDTGGQIARAPFGHASLQALETASEAAHDREGSHSNAERNQGERQDRSGRRRPAGPQHQQFAAVRQRQGQCRTARSHYMVFRFTLPSRKRYEVVARRSKQGAVATVERKVSAEPALPAIERRLLLGPRRIRRRKYLARQFGKAGHIGRVRTFADQPPRGRCQQGEQHDRREDRQPDLPVQPMPSEAGRAAHWLPFALCAAG